jgi:hypothetical protein
MPNDMNVSADVLLQKIDELEQKINTLVIDVSKQQQETKAMLEAFNAAKGAFDFLEGLAAVVKPILFIGGVVAGFVFWLKGGVKI